MSNIKNEAGNLLPQIVSYNYENNPVTFSLNGKLMINATQMAKPFGEHKRPQQWLRTSQSQEFIEELSKAHICALADLVQVKYGGTNSGTWFHEDVALEFARWLSPAFAIWCNDRIKEIMLANANGKTNHTAENLTGQFVQIIGADGNIYVFSIMKAIREFLVEESKATIYSEIRLADKLKAARMLFSENRLELRNVNMKVF